MASATILPLRFHVDLRSVRPHFVDSTLFCTISFYFIYPLVFNLIHFCVCALSSESQEQITSIAGPVATTCI